MLTGYTRVSMFERFVRCVQTFVCFVCTVCPSCGRDIRDRPAVPVRESNTTIKIQDSGETMPATALSLKDMIVTVTTHLFEYQAI